MNLPKKEVIEKLIKEILSHGPVHSQEELANLLNQRLGKSYKISGRRARKICLSIPEVSVHVLTREGSIPKTCPSCGGSLKKIYTKNLKGEKILIKIICEKCGYSGSEGKWVPKRYEFRLK